MSKGNLKAVDTNGDEPAQSSGQFTSEEVEEMRAMARRVIDTGSIIDQPPEFASETEQWEFGRQVALLGRQAVDQGSQQIGMGLLLMRETKRHGEWEAFVKREIGISPQHARKLMAVAQFLVSLPDEYRARVRDLSFRRQQALARVGKEAVAEMDAEGILNDLGGMPDRDFQAALKLQKRAEDAEARLEKYQDEYRQDIHQKKLKETVLQGIPEAIQQARRYSALVGSMGMELSIRGQMIFDRTLAADQLHADQNIRAMQFRQAAAAQLAGVDSAIKALLDLREHIVERAGDITVNDIPGLHAIELDEALENYRWMLDCHGERAEHIGVPEGRRGKRKKR